MTQEFLQDAVVADLRELFGEYRLKNSLGVERAVNVYAQDTPVRQGDDEAVNREAPPEPYVVVRTASGSVEDEDAPQVVEIVLAVCVCDHAPDRQGHRDALHIINEIYRHYAANGTVGRRFVLRYPIRWATGDEDRHPYYYAAMALSFEAPAVVKEEPYL